MKKRRGRALHGIRCDVIRLISSPSQTYTHIWYSRYLFSFSLRARRVPFRYSFGYFSLFSDPYTYNDTRALRLIITTEPTFSSARGKGEGERIYIRTHTHMLYNASVYLRPYIINAYVVFGERSASEMRWGRWCCVSCRGPTGPSGGRDEITIVQENGRTGNGRTGGDGG